MVKVKTYLLILSGIFLGFHGISQEKEVVIDRVTVSFGYGKHNLDRKNKDILDRLIFQLYQMDESFSVDIYNYKAAHDDAVGTKDYLFSSRSGEVFNYLIRQGIFVDHIENNDAYTNLSPSVSKKARSVEVIIKLFLPSDLAAVYNRWQKHRQQVYTIDLRKPNKITALQGTSIWLEQHSFVFENGDPPNDSVDIYIQELFNPSDLVMFGANTISDKRPISMEGLIKVKAMIKDKPLKLRDTKEVKVGFPTINYDPEMELFQGLGAENKINQWRQLKQKTGKDMAITFFNYNQPPQAPNYEFSKPFSRIETQGISSAPIRPEEPVPPIKPNRDSIRDTSSVLNTFQLFRSAKQKQKLLDDLYRKAIEKYRLNRSLYEDDSIKYVSNYALYQDDSIQYERALLQIDWQNERDKKAHESSDFYLNEKERQKRMHQELMEKHNKRLGEWERVRQQTLYAFEQKYYDVRSPKPPLKAPNYYYFKTNNIDWIGCGTFIPIKDGKNEPINVTIENFGKGYDQVFILVDQTNCILTTTVSAKGTVRASGIPQFSRIHVLGLKVVNGLIQLSTLTAEATSTIDAQEQPEPISTEMVEYKYLSTQLEKLN